MTFYTNNRERKREKKNRYVMIWNVIILRLLLSLSAVLLYGYTTNMLLEFNMIYI